jgi:uncharacterized Zn finger protein
MDKEVKCPKCNGDQYWYKYINKKEIIRCEECGYFEYITNERKVNK